MCTKTLCRMNKAELYEICQKQSKLLDSLNVVNTHTILKYSELQKENKDLHNKILEKSTKINELEKQEEEEMEVNQSIYDSLMRDKKLLEKENSDYHTLELELRNNNKFKLNKIKKLEEEIEEWKDEKDDYDDVEDFMRSNMGTSEFEKLESWWESNVAESVVTEAEVNSDEEFEEYAVTVLQKAFGEDFDEAKSKKVIDGILSKADGDYGTAVGMLTSSLGQ